MRINAVIADRFNEMCVPYYREPEIRKFTKDFFDGKGFMLVVRKKDGKRYTATQIAYFNARRIEDFVKPI